VKLIDRCKTCESFLNEDNTCYRIALSVVPPIDHELNMFMKILNPAEFGCISYERKEDVKVEN